MPNHNVFDGASRLLGLTSSLTDQEIYDLMKRKFTSFSGIDADSGIQPPELALQQPHQATSSQERGGSDSSP